MNETKVTVGWVVAAVLLAGAALWTTPPASDRSGLSEEGKPLFPEFADPTAASSIEIITWDKETAGGKPFKVERRGHRWVLPSHQDYPAEAQDRLVKLAGNVIPMKKDSIQSDLIEDHAKLGVIDPLDPKAVTMEGMGTRVTLRGDAGVLADMILGTKAEGSGFRYVRLPDQKTVYRVKTDLDPSAEFKDWIEPDLLKLSNWDLRKIEIDNHRVDEARGAVLQGEVLSLSSKDGSTWTLEDKAENEELVNEKLNDLKTAMDDLKIVDVLRKPDQVVRALKGEAAALQPDDVALLQQKGFYLVQGKGLFCNEGEIRAWTDKGVRYILRFGELAPGGKENEERRYIFVSAGFDETFVPEPEKPEEKDAWKTKVADGKKKADELTTRFAEWFYIIPGAEFKKTRLKRPDLARMKIKLWESKPEEVAALSIAKPEWGTTLALAKKENLWSAELPPGPTLKAKEFWIEEALKPAASVVARRLVENADPAATGLGDDAAVTVTFGANTLKIGATIDDDRYVAHGDKVYRVEASTLTPLLDSMGMMVELKLFAWKPEEAASITIHTSAGDKTLEKEAAAPKLKLLAALDADDVRALGKIQDETLLKAETWIEVTWTDPARKKLRLTIGDAPVGKPRLRHAALSDRAQVALLHAEDVDALLKE